MLRMSEQGNSIHVRQAGKENGCFDVRCLLSDRARTLRAYRPSKQGISLAACLFLLFALSALGPSARLAAQTPPAGTSHSVTLSWVAPSPVGGSGVVSGYNVYRSVGGAAFAKINTALIAGLTTTDTAVASGQSDKYCATTVDTNNEESACSITITATIPSNPNPPTLSAPVVALNINGNKETLTATWTDAPGSTVAYVIWNGTKILARGVVTDSKNTGNYSVSWSGKAQPTYLEIFDSTTAEQPAS